MWKVPEGRAKADLQAAVQGFLGTNDMNVTVRPKDEQSPLLCSCSTMYIFRHQGGFLLDWWQ